VTKTANLPPYFLYFFH